MNDLLFYFFYYENNVLKVKSIFFT